jgi:hypothetical protein
MRRLAIVALLLGSSAIAAQPTNIIAAATAKKKTIDLSESLGVTLSIEGPAPLRVELPKQLLVSESDRDWKIQSAGSASVSSLGGGRERWVQNFRLDPYVFGTAQTILFAPIKVNGREIPGPGCEVTVHEPKIEARPGASMSVTKIEELPAPPEPPPPQLYWLWVAMAITMLAALAFAVRARRRPKPVPPREWALASFDNLEHESRSREALVEGIAVVLRGFIERRFGIPAAKLTTEELLVAAERAAWPVEHADPIRSLLGECDRAKFAGDIPDDDGCRDLLARGREWVDQVCPDTGPG